MCNYVGAVIDDYVLKYWLNLQIIVLINRLVCQKYVQTYWKKYYLHFFQAHSDVFKKINIMWIGPFTCLITNLSHNISI